MGIFDRLWRGQQHTPPKGDSKHVVHDPRSPKGVQTIGDHGGYLSPDPRRAKTLSGARSGDPGRRARAIADIESPQRSGARMTRSGQLVPANPIDHRPSKGVGHGKRLGGQTVTHPNRIPRGTASSIRR